MSTGQPPRGAAVFENELEAGFDERFERRWRMIERGSQVVMLLVTIAAVAGLLGRGPASHRTHRSPDGLISVDFEPICRHGTTTQLTFHLAPRAARANEARVPEPDHVILALSLDSKMAEPMGLQQVTPQPVGTVAGGAAMSYLFNATLTEPAAVVRFVMKPDTVGRVSLHARYLGSEVVWTQWVMP